MSLIQRRSSQQGSELVQSSPLRRPNHERSRGGSAAFLIRPVAVAMLAIGLDVGVARITYGVALPAFARDLQLSLTAAGLLGTLHLVGNLLGTLASPSLDAKVSALAL